MNENLLKFFYPQIYVYITVRQIEAENQWKMLQKSAKFTTFADKVARVSYQQNIIRVVANKEDKMSSPLFISWIS